MIHFQEQERRRAFSMWLRTGRLPSVPNADGIEVKFNPWHDPENGRFTFVGTGRYYGRGDDRSVERRGRGVPRVDYGDDFSKPPLKNIEEVEAWRLEELAKNGHRPGYREGIERRYQYYKRMLARRLEGSSKPIQDAEGLTAAPAPSRSLAPPKARRSSELGPPTERAALSGARDGFAGGGGTFSGGGATGS